MPELPEVELISRSLNTLVSGRKIVSAKLLRPRLAPDVAPASFAKKLRNLSVNFVHRRGKHLLFDLSGGKTLIVHLRMSGRFSILAAEATDPKFTHAVFNLADGERLVFDDQRHFGLMKVVETSQLYEAKELKKLGPEPLSADFTTQYLHTVLRGSKRNLKEFLIDQTKVSGIGNIYACEAMFAAGLDPRKIAHKVTKPRAHRLHESIQAVLTEAISYGSGRPVDPQNLEGNYFSGSPGGGWYVYDREKQPCRHCNELIVRVKQGGRSTYFCRTCQRR
jgi:formamidopyrimidine-DNA glycosylase